MEVLRWWLVSRSLKNLKHQQPGTYNNPKPYPKPYPTPIPPILTLKRTVFKFELSCKLPFVHPF